MGFQLPAVLSSEQVYRALEILPQPNYAEIKLHGFDYLDLLRQAEEISPSIGQSWENPVSEPIFRLIRPSNATLISINRLAEKTDREKSLYIHRVFWHRPEAAIEMTQQEIMVKLMAEEPEYVTRLRKELEGYEMASRETREVRITPRE